MKRVSLKMNYESLDIILRLIKEQVLEGDSYKTVNPSHDYKTLAAFVVGHLAEIYAKYIGKTAFSFTGMRMISLTPLQGYALMIALQRDWIRSENAWTKNILQINSDRLHKQLAHD